MLSLISNPDDFACDPRYVLAGVRISRARTAEPDNRGAVAH
jgi:hypothetical protein